MTMVGSSGVAAPGLSGGSGDGAGSPGGISSPGSTGTGGTGSGTSSGLSHVLISEVYEKPDASHGGKSENGWIEIYNPTSIAADLSGWRLESSTTAATIAAKTLLDPGQFMIFAGTSAVKDLWNLPSSARVIVLPAFFKGSDTFGDHIIIRDSANTKLDSVSWGSDVTAFSPASPQWSIGNSLLRKSLSLDSDSSSDWTTAPSPTPGK